MKNTNRGITLVALVVTIVVLLIIVAITIMYIMGDNSIFKQASDAKLKTDIAQWRERLETAKAPSIIEGLGKFDPDKYFEYIEKQKIINDKDTDVKDNEDGIYDVTTKPGYVFKVELIPAKENPKDAEIEYIGKVDNLGPVIKKLEVTNKSSNSITVEVTVDRLENGKLSYYYKKENEETYRELAGKQNTEDLTVEFIGLEQNQIYNIKVVVENKRGKAEKIVSDITGELQVGSISQKGDTIWTSNKASIELETNPTGLKMEYQVNKIDGVWTSYTGPIGNLDHKDNVYVRITDGINAGDTATIEVRDGTAPTDATIELGVTSTITGADVTAMVTHDDAQSGVKIASCKWVYNTTATKIGSTASSYTGGTFTSNGQTINLRATTSGNYYLHILTTDNAGNVWETVSEAITVKQLATGITVSPTTANLEIGGTKQLTATIIPTNTSNKNVVWTSSNTDMATVSASGLVTAKATGTVNITVTTTDDSNKSAICSITVKPLTVAEIVGKIQTETIRLKDENGDIVTIPGGFCMVKESQGNPNDKNTVQNGLVISDVADDDLDNSKHGNQFVWIPVPDYSKFHLIEGYSSGNLQDYMNPTTNFPVREAGDTNAAGSPGKPNVANSVAGTAESIAMYKSVKDNKGFYIARFEAGVAGTTASTNTNDTNKQIQDGTVKPVSQKGVGVWNFISWGGTYTDTASDGLAGNDNANGAVKVARSMYKNDNVHKVTSTLCYGVQWDAALNFIDPNYESGNAAGYIKDSTGKGQYSGIATTGSNTAYQQKHIYDMAGNALEWTMEGRGNTRATRGRSCFTDGISYPASSRYHNTPGESYSSYYPGLQIPLGFRPALYL